MVELKPDGETNMRKSFAGDVYNSAVYLKRCAPNAQVAMITVVGKDQLSREMVEHFQSHAVECECVFEHSNRAPGLYAIETDAKGERSFTYWRSASAARTVTDYLSDDVLAKISKGDTLFFSGISLAVIEPESRATFWQKMESIKANGATIVFDPNYRQRLWENKQAAKSAFEKAFKMANVIMPGVEDMQMLYGIDSAESTIDFLRQYGARELVVKNGSQSVFTYLAGKNQIHDIQAVENVVDTTSAGDAFNGAYLAERTGNENIAQAVQKGAKAAGIVIQFPGAIVPEQAFADLYFQP